MRSLFCAVIWLMVVSSASAGSLQVISASRSGDTLTVVISARNDTSSTLIGDFGYVDFYGGGYDWYDTHNGRIVLPDTLAPGATFQYTAVMSGIPDSAFSGGQVDFTMLFADPVDGGDPAGGEYNDTYVNLMANYGASAASAAGSSAIPAFDPAMTGIPGVAVQFWQTAFGARKYALWLVGIGLLLAAMMWVYRRICHSSLAKK